jgi:hypothetical protein
MQTRRKLSGSPTRTGSLLLPQPAENTASGCRLHANTVSRAPPRRLHGLIDQEERRHHKASILVTQHIVAAPLKKDADDTGVSTLLWDNCKIYIRSFDQTRIALCVVQNRSRPTCQPGMQFVKATHNMEHRLGDLLAQCRQTFPEAKDQALYCTRRPPTKDLDEKTQGPFIQRASEFVCRE